MIRTTLLALALAAAAPAQFNLHDVSFQANAQVSVIDWNGRLALLVATPGNYFATYVSPSAAVYRWRLDIAMVGLVSQGPQCAGSKFEIGEGGGWNSPEWAPPIPASGVLISDRWAGASLTGGASWLRWEWRPCTFTNRCFYTPPESGGQLLWNVVVAYPTLR